MNHIVRLLGLVLAAALVATACGASGASGDGLPAVELERLDGGSFAVAEAGEPRVLNLWATWCAPCRAELPAFDAVADRLRADDAPVEIIGINVGDTGDDAADLVAELDLDFAQVLDPRAQIQRALKITGMPATIFVDDDGGVLSVHNGELTQGELEALLDEFYDLGLTA